ncbi:MAG: dihydrofolate reductase [Deferribacteres bacterium]|nr:dihydrofolate reductase [candidate division KSB1 bacterium]MCB9500850.1 dihydrofolate reductase [Deferribacteres bacterium]
MKISVYIATSLDGFIARKNGDLDWLPGSDGQGDHSEDYGYAKFIETIDMLVMGRNTFEKVLLFGQWPYGDRRCVVLTSRDLTIPENMAAHALARNAQPKELISELEEMGVQRVWLDGGKTIQHFLREGWVDELIITRVPVLIGNGIPLFGHTLNDINLQHIETVSFESGFVQSRYAFVRKPEVN